MTAAEEWSRCRGWIESALEFTGGMYAIEDVERAIERGAMIFMPGKHSAVVLEIIDHPKGRALNVFAGGGEDGATVREYVEKMDRCVEAYARAAGCRWITHHCRRSGERLGKGLGYKHLWSVMVKELA